VRTDTEPRRFVDEDEDKDVNRRVVALDDAMTEGTADMMRARVYPIDTREARGAETS